MGSNTLGSLAPLAQNKHQVENGQEPSSRVKLPNAFTTLNGRQYAYQRIVFGDWDVLEAILLVTSSISNRRGIGNIWLMKSV
jgi:hypothetical protein